MKTYIKLIVLISTFFLVSSFTNTSKLNVKEISTTQTNPFIGTWQFQNGNELFIVSFWAHSNKVFGHYRKVIVDNNNNIINEIYNSNKEIGTSGENWTYVISASYIDNIIGGTIADNTLVNQSRSFIDGRFRLTIQNSCLGCPTTAIWKVEKSPGFRSINEIDFNIPTDIILTKVN